MMLKFKRHEKCPKNKERKNVKIKKKQDVNDHRAMQGGRTARRWPPEHTALCSCRIAGVKRNNNKTPPPTRK